MDVDKLIGELESMGFSTTEATNAFYAGSSSIEAAITWLFDHQEGNGARMPDVLIKVNGSFEVSEIVKSKAQSLRNQTLREMEETCKVGAVENGSFPQTEIRRSQMTGQSKRKMRHAEKEEKNERERIRQKLQHDKLERRGIFGQAKVPSCLEAEKTLAESTKLPKPGPLSNVTPVRDRMKECLRSIKRSTKNDQLKAMVAFQTLWIYVKNVACNPDELKFRRIRISNPTFQERIASCSGGMDFLELCAFERDKDNQFLFLHRDKVDMELLKLAATELQNACSNPFFGLLSTK